MITKKSKRQLVSLDLIDTPFEHNVREHVIESLHSTAMQESLKMIGQQTTAILEKIGDRYIPLQGNRRTFNLKALAKSGEIDPKTRKLDDKGEPIPNTGKVFSTIEAEVYEGLTPRERLELTIDHGSIRSLNQAETFNAACKTFEVRYTEKETVILLGDLLEDKFPPTRKIKPISEDGGQDRLEYYRGVVQNWKRAYEAPTVLREAFIRKLKGEHRWPTNAELKELHKIFAKERDAKESMGRVNRDNPGPLFMERWNKYLEAQAKAAENGEAKAKAQSMMTRSNLEDLAKTCDSRIFKLIIKAVLREVGSDAFVNVDRILVALEKYLTPEDIKTLDESFTLVDDASDDETVVPQA